MRIFPNRLYKIPYFLLTIAIASLVIVLPMIGQSLIPSPQEADRQASQLSPEQLVKVEVDEAIRDRLRFDPAWQPILRSVQQDIMILKWGDNRLTNPIWKQYGAKVFPLLDYYTRSNDPTRQTYGMVGIRSLGKPYTTLWLEKRLKQRLTNPDGNLLTDNPTLLLNPNADGSYEVNWQKEFGLDDRATRDRLLRIARENLEPPNSPNYYNQFNLAFLNAELGYEAVFPNPSSSLPSLDDLAKAPALAEWKQLEALSNPTTAQQQRAVAVYRGLTPTLQDYVLVTRLGQVKAGMISSIGKAVLNALAQDPQSPDQTWAIAELERHGDAQGRALLQGMLNGNFKALHSLTKWASYEGDFWRTSPVDRGTHAYYLLVSIAQRYPQSVFVQAAKEYGNLTGRSYFGGVPRSSTIQAQIAQQTPAQRMASWQSWLSRYPDHPGADDATYFLARSLQDQNEILPALDIWVRLMTEPLGDGDAAYLAYPHVRTLLDVGLSTQQLEQVVAEYRDRPIAPLFQYALAVHYARAQNYAKAIQTTDGLDLTQMPTAILDSYYRTWGGWFYRDEPSTVRIQREMQAMLTEQRQRWQQLQQLQQANTPEARYQIASNWAGEGGWKNGYLPVWDEDRIYLLPLGDWGDEYCRSFWSCNTRLRGDATVRSSYQQGSQNAIALQLYQALLSDRALPAPLQEKNLFMSAETLLAQWEDYPLGETFRIHPPPGVKATAPAPNPAADTYDQWQANYNQIERTYLQYLDDTIAQLKTEFPTSAFIDDLLFSRYAMSGEPQYLQQIVNQYPGGDRSAEAQFLLAHQNLRQER